MTLSAEDRRIRALRSPKRAVDPFRPLGVILEEERAPGGGLALALTVFLAGRECPFTCVFCDLWRDTLERPTPRGAIVEQVRLALDETVGRVPAGAAIKLYNASNFFDPGAVPEEDLAELVPLLAPFRRVVVECHPRLVGRRCLDFQERLDGRLEVAMGLETVHPEALPRLNKKMTLEDFDAAAGRLAGARIALRAFVLVGAPFVPPGETAAWAVRSAAHAFDAGAERVSLIPVRGGNGEMERLAAAGAFRPPRLEDLEAALAGGIGLGRGVVAADLWEVERFVECEACGPARLARLARMNASGEVEAGVVCGACALTPWPPLPAPGPRPLERGNAFGRDTFEAGPSPRGGDGLGPGGGQEGGTPKRDDAP